MYRLSLICIFASFGMVGPSLAQTAAVDYMGNPFITQKAPVLKFDVRTAPHITGIDYPFAEQTARSVTLFDRFPQFTLSDRRVHLSGPWFGVDTANSHFIHGITSVEAMPNYRLPGGSANIRKIPAAHKWQLMGDSLFWTYAGMLADKLEKANSNDSLIPSLRRFATKHEFFEDERAFTALGRAVWLGESTQSDEKNEGVMYPCIDIEQTGGFEFQRQCNGWLYQGMCAAAAEKGLKLMPISYGQWTFEVGAFWTSMRQGGTGDPEYLLPEKDYVAAPDPTLTAMNDNQGIISMDGYMQAIWGKEPFYKRNLDGSLVMADGKPVFNETAKTTCYGQDIPIEPGEASHCLDDFYRQAVRMYLMYHRFAGVYPANSEQCKPFLKNTSIGAWTRITNEGLLGINANDRPLPPWEIETLVGMYLMTAHDIVAWSSDMNVPSGPLGADHHQVWKYEAYGVNEFLVKALHRYSALDPIHKGPFQWCWFRLPMVNKNLTDGDRYDQKPLVIGKIRTYKNKPWLELYAAYPAADGKPADFKVWVDKDGKRSPAYTVRIANGRSYFYDAWQLPSTFKGLEGKNIWLRFKDQLGVTRTWRGDWRAAVDENVITPKDIR